MAEHYSDNGRNNNGRKKKRKKKKKGNLILFIIEMVILVCLVAAIFIYARINAGLDKIGTAANSGSTSVTSDANQQADQAGMNSQAVVDKVMQGYTNIALLGIDARDGADFDYSNSDTMIILSINNDNGEIRMVSVYRDTYLNINPDGDDYDFQKSNAAYCNGSVKQFLTMINKNMDLTITDYVAVDFKAVAVLVDDVGGIDITMTADEAVHTNNYCKETSKVTGMSYEPLPEEEGTYHVNGVQAVSYARIRYTAGNDYKRTQRQRLVIEKIVAAARNQGIGAVDEVINDVFPLIKTSLSNSMMMKMAAQMIGYYAIVGTSGFPFEHLEDSPYLNSEYVIPVTLEQNVKELHQFLFNDSEYQPSDTVKEYSDYIIDESGFGTDDIAKAKEASEISASGSEADNVT